MRISDWSSDVCSSDLQIIARRPGAERHMLIIDPVPAVDIPALDLVDLAAKLVAAFFELLIQRQWFACRGFRRAGCQQCQCGHTQQGSHGFPTSGLPGCLARAMISEIGSANV